MALGTLRERDGGCVVVQTYMLSVQLQPSIEANMAYLLRRARELLRLGLDPKRIDDHYLSCRPLILELA